MREPRAGFGAACFAGLDARRARDIVCFMDCDASFDPRELPRVADPVAAGDADLMLGARAPVARGAWPCTRARPTRVLALELRRRTGVPAARPRPDARGAPRGAARSSGIRDRRFGWPLEMVLRAADAGWTIREVPRRLPPARRPLEGHRHGARDRARGPRHDGVLR